MAEPHCIGHAPVVSVVMSVFNAGPFLAAAVQSISRQDYTDYELIAVDDGSTDDSLAQLRRLAAGDQRIRVAARPHAGIVDAVSHGLALARGRYIARMDADDICAPGRLARQVAFLDDHADCVAVSGRGLLVDPEGRPLGLLPFRKDHQAIERSLLQGSAAGFIQGAAMIRAESLRQVGGYRKEFDLAEDLDLFLRLAQVGRLHNLPCVVYLWRQHLGSVSHARWDVQFRAAQAAVRDALLRRGMPVRAAERLKQAPRRSLEERQLAWARIAAAAGLIGTSGRYLGRGLRRKPYSLYGWYVAARCLLGAARHYLGRLGWGRAAADFLPPGELRRLAQGAAP